MRGGVAGQTDNRGLVGSGQITMFRLGTKTGENDDLDEFYFA